MISNKMQAAINDQIQAEFASAYLYLAMAAHCKANNLPGFAQWLTAQYREENFHAMKLFDYLLARGGRVTLQAIEAQPVDFGSPAEVFAKVLAHEQYVTTLINGLCSVAVSENDDDSRNFLQWYIDEQAEEEESAKAVIDKIKLLSGDEGLASLDEELGTRK